MDLDDFKAILTSSGVDLWSFIDAAIALASADYRSELRSRRDGIVERLYACTNCDSNGSSQTRYEALDEERNGGRGGGEEEEREGGSNSPPSPRWVREEEEEAEEEELDRIRRVEMDPKSRILAIKEHIEDSNLTEDSLIELLESLADMDMTFQVLKETDIGRNMNGLRKHSSPEVRRLVKQLVRKWKEIVDEWVKSSMPDDVEAPSLLGDSPLQAQSTHYQNDNQVSEYARSPNYQNGSVSADRNKQKLDVKDKSVAKRGLDPKQKQSVTPSPPPPANKPKGPNETNIDMARLASARKRLHENYKEAENAKKQRTIQVMDLQDIPKPKNSFFARGKSGFHGRR